MVCFSSIKSSSSEEQTVIPLRHRGLCSLEETVCWGLFSPTQGQNRRVWSRHQRCDDRPVFVSGYCQILPQRISGSLKLLLKSQNIILLLYATLMRSISMWQTVHCQLCLCREMCLIFQSFKENIKIYKQCSQTRIFNFTVGGHNKQKSFWRESRIQTPLKDFCLWCRHNKHNCELKCLSHCA